MCRTIGLVLKPDTPDAIETFFIAKAAVPGVRFLIERSGHHALREPPVGLEPVDAETFEKESDLVLVLGGDGTLIHAAGLLQNRVVPILGVNMGHVGFLSEVAQDELQQVLPRALDGELPHLDRLRLDAEVRRDGRVVLGMRILNDAVLHPVSLARIATYQVCLRAEPVTTLRADGVIVCTPTGSTAYSMAAGGSILAPGLQAVGITPICPHGLTQRPLVVTPGGEITVTLQSDSSVYATMDGQVGAEFRRGDLLGLKRAPVPTRLLSVPGGSYFKTLRTKLSWGGS